MKQTDSEQESANWRSVLLNFDPVRRGRRHLGENETILDFNHNHTTLVPNKAL